LFRLYNEYIKSADSQLMKENRYTNTVSIVYGVSGNDAILQQTVFRDKTMMILLISAWIILKH